MKRITYLQWPDKNTFLHLRLPFSFFLMPVFMFALSSATSIHWLQAALAFFIFHFLVFPSSNGYNSYQDKDTSSIGILRNPPPVTKSLFVITLVMDLVAIIAGLFISLIFSFFVLAFILVSRAYSYRNIRIKRYPVSSLIVVSLFQGGVVYLASFMAIENQTHLNFIHSQIWVGTAISTLFIGSVYPLTQIYQHQADKADGVISISYKLGYFGTFLFSSVLFMVATYLVFVFYNILGELKFFGLFLVTMIPVIIWLMIWSVRVIKDSVHANYSNTMYMNLITAICMNIFFLFIVINRYGKWY